MCRHHRLSGVPDIAVLCAHVQCFILHLPYIVIVSIQYVHAYSICIHAYVCVRVHTLYIIIIVFHTTISLLY